MVGAAGLPALRGGADRDLSGRDVSGMRKGRGCEACRQSGYRERIGIFELLVVDDGVRTQIQARANASQIRDSAVERGMKTLRDDGIANGLRGATTIEEIVRVTMRSSL